ncbi:MAG: CxxC-x17-CxxC domain-containing protein [Planctomycetota bacterium]|jgi:CxxC-x17-CxxC domain-containing protein
MKDYNTNHKGKRDGGGYKGGSKSYGQGGGYRDRDSGNRGRDDGPKTMHSATCSDCGKQAQVPFRPTGEKPVFCSDCFGAKKDGGNFGRDNNRRDSRDNRDSRDSRGPQRDFRAPTPRDTRAPSKSNDTGKLQKQIDALHAKMDKVMSALGVHTAEPTHTQTSASNDTKKVEKRAAPAKGELKAAIAKAIPEKTTKKAPKKTAAKKVTKKAAPKKPVAKKVAAKKDAPKKTVVKKVAKKAPAKKASKK